MDSHDEALVGLDDAINIGFKIVEMADRVRVGHKIMPGSLAKWQFTIDGVNYHVTVGVKQDG